MSIPLSRFGTSDSVADWHTFGGVVMGGLSTRKMTYDPHGHAVFSGEVSLANDGGFASVRSPLASRGSSRASAYLLTVRGCSHGFRIALTKRPAPTSMPRASSTAS